MSGDRRIYRDENGEIIYPEVPQEEEEQGTIGSIADSIRKKMNKSKSRFAEVQ